ncbi:MAG: hypothetical protein HQL76_12195 [Magnetococcales bacterium]|nr:hypothetical protein [Magnetococcales bacterium]
MTKLSDDRQRQDWLERKAPALGAQLFGLGSTGELLRFAYLYRMRRLANLWEMTAIAKPELPVPLVNALKTPDSIVVSEEFTSIKEKWYLGLIEQFTGDLNQEKLNILDSDAEMLAWVEWINNELQGTRHRLVLLTGAPLLFAQARKVISNRSSSSKKLNFADSYLRHPKAFLAEPSVLFPSPRVDAQKNIAPHDNKKRFWEWLESVLSYSKGFQDGCSRKELEIPAREALTTHPELLQDFKREWTNYRFSVLPVHPISDPALAQNQGLRMAIDNRIFDLFKVSQGIDDERDKIRKILEDQVERNWYECFSIGTLTGILLFQMGREGSIPVRNPPPIFFSTFSQAFRFIQLPFFDLLIQASANGSSPKADEFRNALDQLREEDPTGYTFYLGAAQLYAMAGYWNIANIQAKQAFHIAEYLSHSKSRISGREAAYMRAVTRRHMARSIDDLPRVQEHLQTALDRLERDRNRPNPTSTTDLRFRAEALAVHVTAHLFRAFPLNKGPKVPQEFSLFTLESTEKRLKELVESLVDHDQTNPWVLLQVEQNLLVNIFMIALLRYREGPESINGTDYLNWYQKLANCIEKMKNNTPPITITFYVRVIRGVARWWVGTDDNEREEARREVDRLLPDRIIDDRSHSVFPYDKKRYRFLRGLVDGTWLHEKK